MKAIQKQRTQRFFMDAVKTVLEKHGPEGLSARTVGKAAGYSYATIYNYYRDFNHLLWHVSLEYRDELAQHLQEHYQLLKQRCAGRELLLEMFTAHAAFFLERPHIYTFLFAHPIGEVPAELRERMADTSLRAILWEHLGQVERGSSWTAADVQVMADVLVTMVHGLLVLYFSGKRPMAAADLLNQVRRNAGFVLGLSEKKEG